MSLFEFIRENLIARSTAFKDSNVWKVKKMNEYKLAWMQHCNIHHDNSKPAVDDRTQNVIPDNIKLGMAVTKTVRAAAVAYAISQVDGPLPVADVLAAAYFTTSAVMTWHEYFTA